jgi:hypothetical protein
MLYRDLKATTFSVFFYFVISETTGDKIKFNHGFTTALTRACPAKRAAEAIS